MNSSIWDTILVLITVLVSILLYRFGRYVSKKEAQEKEKHETLQKAFYATNRCDIDKMLKILSHLDKCWDAMTEVEQIDARRAKLHLQGALEFQKMEYLLQAGELTIRAGKRLTELHEQSIAVTT